MTLLVLSGTDVDRVVSKFEAEELTSLMARVFVDLAAYSGAGGDSKGVVIPHRSTISSPNHHTLFMPSRLAPLAGTAIKIVSVPTATAPREVKARGLPASTMVLDEQTGEVSAVVKARKLTALRNAASSLLATWVLGPQAPNNIVAIGAGAQVAAHLSLFLAQYPSIRTCNVFNRAHNDRMSSLISDLGDKFASRVRIEGHALAVENGGEHPDLCRLLREADIVITATSSTSPLFPSSYISPGTHLCLIGSYTPAMHEIDTELVKRAGRVVVDYRAGAASEAGELISAGLGPSDVTELGELIRLSGEGWVLNTSAVEAVQRCGDVTIFKSVGVGIQDVAITHAVVQKAKELTIGTTVADYQ